MDKNNRLLRISIISIIISGLIALIAMNISTLDNPVFLLNNREIDTSEREGIYSVDENSFYLKYISNLEDKRHVVGIKFKEASDTVFFVSENSERNTAMFYDENNSNVVNCGRYGIHTVYISAPDFKYEEDKDEVILTEATVEFNDGSKLDIDLGKIILFKNRNIPVAMKNNSMHSSSDGVIRESKSTFQMDEDVIIEKIESPFMEEALNVFDFTITTIGSNENEEVNYVEGTPIKKDSIISISSTYSSRKDILEKYTIYDIKPEIFFINNYNDRYSARHYNMNNCEPYYSCDYDYCEIYKYLKARGEI